MKAQAIFSHWGEIRAGLLETLDKFEEADFAYTPFESGWTVGQIVLHIADAEEGWIRYVVQRELDQWPDQYQPENYPTFAAAKVALAKVHTSTERYLASLEETDLERMIDTPWGGKLSLLWITWHVVEHEIHHRGELSLILGLLGREGLEV